MCRDNPAAALAGNRLHSAQTWHDVSGRNADNTFGTLQDSRPIYHFTHNPAGDFLRLSGSLRLL